MSATQFRAAPMPRFGSSGEERVCRVPKLTSFSTVAFSRAESGASFAAAGVATRSAARGRIRCMARWCRCGALASSP